MTSSLVGSEMCIRDRGIGTVTRPAPKAARDKHPRRQGRGTNRCGDIRRTVSYTHLTLPTICSV
eukprot:10205470-Prorocentrum_lima.AAC.1